MYTLDRLCGYDKEVGDAVAKELNRQRYNIELIASENIVSQAVLLAAGTVLTNKYAEGYPGKRYYGGCEYVDIVENIAIETMIPIILKQFTIIAMTPLLKTEEMVCASFKK